MVSCYLKKMTCIINHKNELRLVINAQLINNIPMIQRIKTFNFTTLAFQVSKSFLATITEFMTSSVG